MKRKVFLVIFAIFSCIIGAQAITRSVTYTFNSKNWAATDDDGNAANWSVTKVGTSFINELGVQVTTSNSGAKATSPVAFSDISSVVVRHCTNKSAGKGTIKIKIGDNEAMSYDVVAPSENGRTLRDAVFTPETLQSGKVALTVNVTANSVYIYSVTINYEDATGVYDPEFSVAPGTYDEAQNLTFSNLEEGVSVRYTSDASVNLKGNSGFEVWDGVSAIPIKLSQTIRAIATDGTNFSNEVTAEYVLKAEAPSITAAVDSKGNFYTETLDVTISSKYSDFSKLIMECKVTEGESTRDISVTSNPFTFQITGTATISALVAYNADGAILEVSDACEATFTRQNSQTIKGVFSRVDNTGDINAGDEVIVVTEKGGKVMGLPTSDGNKRKGVDEDVNGACRLAENSEASVYLLKEGSTYGKYYMYDSATGEYVDLSSTGTSIGINQKDVSITFDGIYAIIKDSNSATRMLLWSALTETFGNYSQDNYNENDGYTSYNNVQLYKKLTGNNVTATVECEYNTEELKDGHSYPGAEYVILTCDGVSTYSLVHDGSVTNVVFENDAMIDVFDQGSYTIATPNALYTFEVTASEGPSTPTGIETMNGERSTTIYGTEGAVVIANATGNILIFDAMGRFVKKIIANGDTVVDMPAGYYVVCTLGATKAVLVK